MSYPTQAQSEVWNDPVVQEMHTIRTQLVEKYHGDMAAYSKYAKAHAMALGFRFEPMALDAPDSTIERVDNTAFPTIPAKDIPSPKLTTS
jgi:hypothetical protein